MTRRFGLKGGVFDLQREANLKVTKTSVSLSLLRLDLMA
jgi:hypothetical protein